LGSGLTFDMFKFPDPVGISSCSLGDVL
jgi:hypothetical protein